TTYRGHTLGVYCLAISGDGKTLATGGGAQTRPQQGELILWDLDTGKPRQSIAQIENNLWAVAYSPDGKWLAASGNRTVPIGDTEAYRLRAALAVNGRPLAFSPDGKFRAVGQGRSPSQDRPGEGNFRLWETATWQERAFLPAHKTLIFSVAFSPDGKSMASA